ncbi:MAG: DUF1177 domain-containing protein [Chloroflexi bacterium]|nr:DUF1177 domain-containing protein [Chloroflexota bacterium]
MLKQVMEIYDLLDRATITGAEVADYLREHGLTQIQVETVRGEQGSTDFVKVLLPGSNGRMQGGSAPTLGLVGRLGGIGARPERIGLVSDADGAITVLACALKLALMARHGDILPGDAIIATHVCPHAPTQPHDPVPFMGSPVDIAVMNRYEVDPRMDAVLSVDTTKGNRIINHRGFAISPTVKEGYILRPSDDLLTIMERVTGRLPVVLALSVADITPYGNGLHHINSIMQPTVATKAPVVGVAITVEVPVPGCGTGASHEIDIELAARFCLEVAKELGAGGCTFYDPNEFARLVSLYGPMTHLQTIGRERG